MFLVAFFWGLAWPVGRILATDLLDYPYSVMFFRYLFAIPVLFGWLWFKEGNVVPLKRDYSYLLLLAFTSVFLYQFGYMFGMQKTAASCHTNVRCSTIRVPNRGLEKQAQWDPN